MFLGVVEMVDLAESDVLIFHENELVWVDEYFKVSGHYDVELIFANVSDARDLMTFSSLEEVSTADGLAVLRTPELNVLLVKWAVCVDVLVPQYSEHFVIVSFVLAFNDTAIFEEPFVAFLST